MLKVRRMNVGIGELMMTASELQAAILATQKQIANTMSPMRKRDLQRHLARLRRKLRAVERGRKL